MMSSFFRSCLYLTAALPTMQVLGTIKNAIVVWIGIIFLQELVTKLQVSYSGYETYSKVSDC